MLAALLVATGVTIVALLARSSAEPRIEWLPGFVGSAASDERSQEAADELAATADVADTCSTFDAQQIVADVTPQPGRERILASVATGVVILDARGRLVASAPLAECGGSSDEIVALAAGQAWVRAPVIAVVFSTGGHREADTELALFRVDRDRLTAIFDGVIEHREGLERWRGAAIVIPGAVVYQPPQGALVIAPLRPAEDTGSLRGS